MRLSDGMLMVLIVMLSIFAPLSTDMFLPALDEMVVYFDTDESTMSMTMYMFMLFLAIGILFLGPVGIILGPFLGALLGELIHTHGDMDVSFKSAWGAFLGFLCGTGSKLIVVLIYIWIYVASFF